MSDTQDDITSRKGEHIKWCLHEHSQSQGALFESVQLPYRALPEIALKDVSTETSLFGKTLSQPLIISSMTGGTKHGIEINTNLAIAAESEKVALAIGSQRIALEKPEALKTFEVIRKHAPTAFVIANMGAVQLNYGYDESHYRRVVDMVEADALYLHINALQEAVQPGGDTNFRGLIDKIIQLVQKISVPVFVKEVGHGIDLETAQILVGAGVKGIDVAGVGGTSYAWVEAQRARNDDFAEWFKAIGVSTEQAIRDIAPIKQSSLLIASGGIRSPIEGYKAHLLGADLYASTQPFLSAALKSSDAVIAEIKNWQKGLQIAQFVTARENW